MATREQMLTALRNADAAGDTEAATRIATMLKGAPAPKERGEISTAWDNLKSDVKTALMPDTTPRQRNGPLPANANIIDKGMHFLAGGDNGTGEVHTDTQGGQQAMAADRVGGDIVDLPVSIARAGLRKLGLSHDAASTVVNTGLMVAPALPPMARDAGMLAREGGAAVGRVAQPVVENVAERITAERRGKALAGQMGATGQEALKGAQANLRGQAAADQAQAGELQAQAQARYDALKSKADRARKVGAARLAQKLDADAAAVAPELNLAPVQNASELGDTVRTATQKKFDDISDNMRKGDTQFREAMEEVAADREANGVYVTDMPVYKDIIKKSRAVVDPDPVMRPNTGKVPANSAGAGLHKLVLDHLSPDFVRLDPDLVPQVLQQGGKVVQRGGEVGREIPPSFKNVDELRRQLGEAANRGELEGYGAINKMEARDLYGKVTSLMDQYSEGTHADVQANWRMGKKALEDYEKSKMGRNLVGLQKGTDNYAAPASSIPGRIISGGRDAVDQATFVAGEQPVRDMLRGHIQNELRGKNAAQLESAIAPGTQLADVLSTDSDLAAAVREHINNTRAAEQAGSRAKVLAGRADTNMGRADKYDAKAAKTSTDYDQIAQQLNGQASKSLEQARGLERRIAQLEQIGKADPRKVGAEYKKILDEEHAAQRISDQQYRDGLSLAGRAEKAFKMKDERDNWVKEAGWLAGGGTLGTMIGGPFGFVAGVGAGHTARTVRNLLIKKSGGH